MKKSMLLFFVLILPIFFVQQQETYAESTAYFGLVKKVEGEVLYQKGAALSKFPLGISQKWDAGDVIRTQKGASTEIFLPATGDTFYIGENTEVYFTEKDDNLFVHVLKGNIYVVAEKREAVTEALYIISGKQKYKVLGTQFFVQVDTNTNLAKLFVSSGIVNAQQGDRQREENIYPGQSYFPNDSVPMPIDPASFINSIDPSIIAEIIRNYGKALEENEQFVEELLDNSNQSPSGFPYMSEDEISNYERNLNALVAKIVDEAINNGKVDEREIQKIIDEVNMQGGPQFDLDDASKYKRDYSDAQKKVQEAAERRRQAEERKRQELLEKRDEQMKKQQNIVNEIEEKRKIQQEKLAEKRRMQEEENRKRLEEERRPAPTPPSRPRPTPDPNKLDPISISSFLDGEFVYVNFDDEEINYASYEIWVNGVQLTDSTFDAGQLLLDAHLFTLPENEIEVFGLNELNKKVAYGKAHLNRDVGLELLRINPQSVYLAWNPVRVEHRDGMSLEIYESGNDNPIKIIKYKNPLLSIPNLNPNTQYTLVEKFGEKEINTVQFETKQEGWIDYTENTISWHAPAGNDEEVTYNVYVNGLVVVSNSKENSYVAENLLGEGNQWLVMVEIFSGETVIGTYESIFKTSSNPF